MNTPSSESLAPSVHHFSSWFRAAYICLEFPPLWSGWWLGHPSEKYESQLGWLATQFMGKCQKWQPNHQPVMVFPWMFLGCWWWSQWEFAWIRTMWMGTHPPWLVWVNSAEELGSRALYSDWSIAMTSFWGTQIYPMTDPYVWYIYANKTGVFLDGKCYHKNGRQDRIRHGYMESTIEILIKSIPRQLMHLTFPWHFGGERLQRSPGMANRGRGMFGAKSHWGIEIRMGHSPNWGLFGWKTIEPEDFRHVWFPMIDFGLLLQQRCHLHPYFLT